MSQTTQISAQSGSAPEPEAAPILVGYDGSEGGHDALALARVLAAAQGARCEVAAKVASHFSEAHAALGDPSAATHLIGSRSPDQMLVECAGRTGAGTLVVGSPHLSGFSRLIFGSVAEQVLHRAPCEVAVAPAGYAGKHHQGIEKIAVAFDGTGESKAALRRAEEIARRSGASLEILVAEDPVVSGVEAAKDDEARDRDAMLTSASAVLAAAIGSVDPAIDVAGKELNPGWRQVVSEIAEAIVAACGTDVDLLVAGTRKTSERLLLGSVTKRLLHTAPFPVLVVPHA